MKTGILILAISIITSCGSSKKVNTNYVYFNDDVNNVVVQQKEILIQPNDLLSIQVFSRTLNQEQAAIFNTPAVSGNQVQGYAVSVSGNIDLPLLGSIKAAGLTKSQLQVFLADKLTEYVKNPAVLVKYLQFNINVLGEVRMPGIQKFQSEKVTIIDAISAAGDLTDFGMRENIVVLREEDGIKKTYTVDLSKKTIFDSPVYLLHPNDIVYVSPNMNKLRNISVNPDAQRRTGLFFGVLSAAVSVATLVLFAVRN